MVVDNAACAWHACWCRADEAGRFVSDGQNGTARFPRSQSQNDLDRHTGLDDRFHGLTSAELKSSMSGFNIEQRDRAVGRHPSDAGDRPRTSYRDWDDTRMPQTSVDPRTGDLEHRERQQFPPQSDPARNLDTSQPRDHRDVEYRRDNGVRRLHSADDRLRRSHEDLSNVSALSQRSSGRTENPKNQDIINWLKRGDPVVPRPAGNADGRDFDDSVTMSNYNRSSNDSPADKPSSRTRPTSADQSSSSRNHHPVISNDSGYVASAQPPASASGLLTSRPTPDRDQVSYTKSAEVTNPTREAGVNTAAAGDESSSVRLKDSVTQPHSYISSRPDSHVQHTGSAASSRHWHQSDDASFHGHIHNSAYTPGATHRPLAQDQRDGLAIVPPPKPLHTVFPSSPPSRGLDRSEDLPPSLPPKLASQHAALKPANVTASHLDHYQAPVSSQLFQAPIGSQSTERQLFQAPVGSRSTDGQHFHAPPAAVSSQSQLRVPAGSSREEVDCGPEYAVVHKGTSQGMMSVSDSSWRQHVVRPGADGAGSYPPDMYAGYDPAYPPDMSSRSRQSPDGTLDEASGGFTTQPLAQTGSSRDDVGSDQRAGSGNSSQDNLVPPRPALPSHDVLAGSGIVEHLPTARRTEPQGGVENVDFQVNVLFLSVVLLETRITSSKCLITAM